MNNLLEFYTMRPLQNIFFSSNIKHILDTQSKEEGPCPLQNISFQFLNLKKNIFTIKLEFVMQLIGEYII